MYMLDYNNLDNEFSKNGKETREEGYNLDISTKRASAIADMAVLYCETDGKSRYVPNSNFSDAEVILFEIMCRIYRAKS